MIKGLIINVDFCRTEKVFDLSGGVFSFHSVELLFEGNAFQQSYPIRDHGFCVLLEQPGVSVIVGTPEKYMLAVKVAQMQLEEFYLKVRPKKVLDEGSCWIPFIFSSALSFPGPTSIKSNSILLPVNPR